eukprot:m.241549 g.241549  ORF g.241549 m.241549 type:complete len:84 (+) comp15327_c0_seq3:97-348(+)
MRHTLNLHFLLVVFVSRKLSTLHRTSETDEVLPDELTTNLIDILAWVNRLVPDSATDVTNLSKRNPFVTINADATLLDVSMFV